LTFTPQYIPGNPSNILFISIGKPHFWSLLIEDYLYFVTVADKFQYFPIITLIAKLLLLFLDSICKKHTRYIRNKGEGREKEMEGKWDAINCGRS
jgi:hypothetical protein